MLLTPKKKKLKHHNRASVCVLLSVYNGEYSLDVALESVFKQSFQDFVVVAVDDASTDESQAILKKWQGKFSATRFIIVRNIHNLGLTRSLNRGLKKCQSKYVARIDADDVWSPNKLALQVCFLEKASAVGVIGSWYTNVGKYSQRNFDLPTTNVSIKRSIYRINPFGHSCVLIRKKLLDRVGGYDSNIRYSQDRDLWFRLMNQTEFCNLPLYLCRRQTANNISNTKSRQQMWQSLKIRFHYANKYRASFYTYIYLILPILIILKPRFISTFQARGQILANVKLNDFTDTHKHNLLFVNDRPLVPHRAETIARQAMSKAFATHTNIKKVFVRNIFPLQAVCAKLSKKYHVVYLRCGSVVAAIISLRLFLSPQTLILEVHNLDAKKINYFASRLYRIAVKRVDLFVTIDPLSSTTWAKYGASQSNIIELSSATVSRSKARSVERTDLLDEFSLPKNKKLIVYAGNLYRDRGIENILQSAKYLASKPFVFVIAGGSQKDILYYKDNIAGNQFNNVYFLGHIPHAKVMSLLTVADLILVTYSRLCPTVDTMSPIKLIEALATDTRVIAADLPRIRTLAQGYGVTYYTPDDTQDLKKNILHVLSASGDKQKKRNLLDFTWKKRVNRILDQVMI